MTNQNQSEGLSPKEFFEGEWYKDGSKQLCADGWPTFIVPVNIQIRKLIEENDKLKEYLRQVQESHKRQCDLNDKIHAKNQKLADALKFYANPESWIDRNKDSWKKSRPKGDDEMLRDYKHPETDWTGTVVVGGKKAREVLKELDGTK